MSETLLKLILSRLDFVETLHVVVGSGDHRTSFVVHKDIISRRSPFFKAASSARWATDKHKTIELPDDEPTVFSICLQAMYQNTVAAAKVEDPPVHQHTFSPLAEAYILADKLGDLTTCNLIVDEIIRYGDEHNTLPNESTVKIVWEKSIENSPLRRLLIDCFVHDAGTTAMADIDEYPHGFVCSMLKEYKRLKEEPEAEVKAVREVYFRHIDKMEKCHYHQHNEHHPKCGQ